MISISNLRKLLRKDYLKNDDNYFIQNRYTKIGQLTEQMLLYGNSEGFKRNPHKTPTGQVYDFIKVIMNADFEILDEKADKFEDFINTDNDTLKLALEFSGTKQSLKIMKNKFMTHRQWFISENEPGISIKDEYFSISSDISYNIKNKYPDIFKKDMDRNIYVKGNLFGEDLHGYIDFKIDETIYELKTTSDIDLKKVIRKNRYDIQLALYYMLYKQTFPDEVISLPVILIASTEVPEHPKMFRMTHDDIRIALYGNQKNEGLFHLIHKKRYFDKNPQKMYSERFGIINDLNLFK